MVLLGAEIIIQNRILMNLVMRNSDPRDRCVHLFHELVADPYINYLSYLKLKLFFFKHRQLNVCNKQKVMILN